ncbi:MAG TPA: hypothetical protein VF806_04730, partial [Anaerolineaceae bacterium]
MDADHPNRHDSPQSNPGQRRTPILALLLLWLLAGLACNLPVFATATPDPQRPARETLAAYLLVTRTPLRSTADGATPAAPIPGQDPANPPIQYTPYFETPFAARTMPASVPPAQGAALNGGVFRYVTQPGDTLDALAG